jgi:dipeptidyl aminopeptidase/acylaminoacyl peptidase
MLRRSTLPAALLVGMTTMTACGPTVATTDPSATPRADAAEAPLDLSGYRTPPAPIAQILDTPPTPSLNIAPDRERVLLIGRTNLPPITVLAEPELRLAGTRLNPITNGPSRTSFSNRLTVRGIENGEEVEIDLPDDPRINYIRWSPNGERIAFTHTTDDGYELWVADSRTGASARVLGAEVNAAVPGTPYDWMPDSETLIVARVVPGRGPAPAAPITPAGPVIQEGEGPPTPGRTYQDLLENPHHEALYEHHFSAQLSYVSANGGAPRDVGSPGILRSFDPSPSGEYLLVSHIKRPFSYNLPWSRFPYEVSVLARDGSHVRQVADLPLADDIPIAFDGVATGPRSVHWRADAPNTLVWVEAQDGGDPRAEAEVRDRVLMLDAPFSARPQILADLGHRYAGLTWGRDDVALLYSRWWNDRNQRIYHIQPGELDAEPRLLVDRSYQDRYNDPGSPLTTPTGTGHSVLLFSADGEHLFLTGQGASPEGDRPFIDRFNIETGESERIWRSESPFFESVVTILDDDAHVAITRRQAADEPPNFFTRDLIDGTFRPITDFEDPAPQLAGIGRELITYPRADGVMLSGTLYTPPGYDPEEDGPLPLLMWAYPREFRDADAASQITGSPYQFVRPGGSSHLFLLTQGYAILDGPAMPVLGEGDAEPNDTFVEQLVMSAEAAIDEVVRRGVAERDRIAIGGHSYGAFMTANLLAHSDLFAAGIARSGAYNRTFTPFGFQAEQRTFWQAQDVYMRMSPFTYAHQITAPILLIHGDSDNNSGTFPVQSERFYAALRGNGATVRLVMLPHESHGYVARESVFHVLAEQIEWLDRYLKADAEVASEEMVEAAVGM